MQDEIWIISRSKVKLFDIEAAGFSALRFMGYYYFEQ